VLQVRAVLLEGHDPRWHDALLRAQGRAHLELPPRLRWLRAADSAEDSFGNAVDYIWEGAGDECRIKAITWGQNDGASLGSFAAIEMEYETSPSCAGVPVGSQTSYRTGVPIVTGASQLRAIEVVAFPALPTAAIALSPIPRGSVLHTRRITLGYSTETSRCDVAHAPYRALTSITEHASNADQPAGVTLPPTTFSYGEAALPWTQTAVVTQALPWPGAVANAGHNLGWGYRFSGGGEWPTVEAMMIDIDGDGRLDRLVNEPRANHTLCGARWERNVGENDAGNLQFVDGGYIEIPTLKWATVPGYVDPVTEEPDPYQGGARARESGGGSLERCALNYQRTGYINSLDGGASSGLACMPGLTQCPASGVCASGDDCTGKNGMTTDTMFTWRWFDIDGDRRPDLVGSPIRGGLISYNLLQGTGVQAEPTGGPREPPILWARNDRTAEDPPLVTGFPACPSTPFTAKPSDPNMPYTRCGGMFPWFVYKNHGNGHFGRARPKDPSLPDETHVSWGPVPDEILYQPIPLESSAGDSSMLSMPQGQYEGMTDIDGDGAADAAHASGANWTQWQVYLNDGSGQLEPASSAGESYVFATGENDALHVTGFDPDSPHPVAIEGLVDLNGDGLDDHWESVCPEGSLWASCQAYTTFHTGRGFGAIADTTIATPRLGTDAETFGINARGDFVARSRRYDARRLVDVDFDGRPDIVRFADGTTQSVAQLNVGGAFGDPVGSIGHGPSLVRKIVASDAIPGLFNENNSYTWEIRSDMIDLDGDGIAEGVDFNDAYDNEGQMQLRRIETPVAPPRLLVSIDNHRGAVTTVRYSPMQEPTVVQTTNHTSPSSQWVVQSITTTDDFSLTSATTSYRYIGPEQNRDDRGHWGFRGFHSVEITSPSGSRVDERYSYAPDWSGRLVAKMVSAGGEGPDDLGPRTIEDVEWTAFPGRPVPVVADEAPLVTYHPTITDQWTCKNGQTEIECRASTDTRTRTVTTYSEFAPVSGGEPMLWQAISSRLQAGAAANLDPDAPDRTVFTNYQLYSTETAYRLRQVTTGSFEHAVAGDRAFGRTSTTWDAEFRVPLTSGVLLDGGDTAAVERRAYDMTTGNLIARWKPEQNARSTSSAQFAYDAAKRFMTKETNELGHETFFEHEPGTGTRIATIGPNRAACATGMISMCPPGTREREETRVRIDGFGRTTERSATFSDDGGIYVPRTIERVTYVDNLRSGAPRSTHRESAIDLDATSHVRYTSSTTTYDGHGRALEERIATGAGDQVTTYAYRDDGVLRQVTVPDPSASVGDTRTVVYLYDFDSLGRPTEITRPDAVEVADRSRVRISYNGLARTTREVVGFDGGLAASTTSVDDRYGRLARVEEDLGARGVAATQYLYGPDDLVRTIVDPEGVTTYLRHDLAGRRTEIERTGRVWRYGYDRNGNMVSQVVPHATTTLGDTAFTVTTAYDDLDRPRSKLIGQRELSVEDQALFATGSETFTWDEGPGQIGRLRFWKTFAPGATTPAITIDTISNAQGQRTRIAETLSIAGYTNLTRQLSRDYHLSGAPRTTLYRDEIGGVGATSSRLTLDARGLPSSMVLSITGQPDQTIAAQTRNLAGLVTRRRTDVATAMEYVESSWGYDRLGRVRSQVVQKGPQLAKTQIVRQDVNYFGNDNPKSMDHWLGTTNKKQFTFAYDQRHQLERVDEAGNAFRARYLYSVSGRFASAEESALALPNSNVKPRVVAYQYAGADPEEVTALTKADGTTFASYEHDASGNRTYQCEGTIRASTTGNAGSRRPAICVGESLDMIYDGKDQLRRVIRKTGGAIAGSEEYWYDGGKQRVATVARDRSRNKTRLVWWLDDTEAHFDNAGDLEKVHSHLSLGTPVARVTRTSSTSTSVELQFHGLASNTLAAVDQPTGTVNASFVYAPFGELIEATDGGGANGLAEHRRRMNDKFIDEVSELAYYGFRYLDRVSMLWTQSDPLYRAVPDAAQLKSRRSLLHSFSLNNPLRYIDPDGRDSTDAARKTPGWCRESPQGCVIDPSGTNTLRTAGTATNQAKDMVNDIMAGATQLVPGQIDSAGTISDLTSAQAAYLRRMLFKILTTLDQARNVISVLMNGGWGGPNEGRVQTQLLLTTQRGTGGKPDADGKSFYIQFNTTDRSRVQSVSGWVTGAPISIQDTPPDARMYHELVHAYRYATGVYVDDSHLGDDSIEEQAAMGFENTYRAFNGYMLRAAYSVPVCWGCPR